MRSLVFYASFSLLVACVGDSTVLPDAGGNDASTTQDVVGKDSPIADVAIDTPLVCDGGATVIACNGSCVDITSSGANCGACGHDCGGGTCTGGACQPMIVVDTLTNPVFDTDGTNVFYQKGSGQVVDLVSCSAAGCKLQPTTIGAPGYVYASNENGNVRLFGKNIAFFGELGSNPGRPRIFACDPVGGCSTSPVTMLNAGLQGFGSGLDLTVDGNDVYFTYYHYLEHVVCTAPNTCGAPEQLVTATGLWPRIGLSADSNGIYYMDPTTHNLVTCAKSGACVPKTLAGPLASTIQNTFAFNNNVYILDSQLSGYQKGSISVCPNVGTCTASSFVTLQSYPTMLWVDAEGVYWFNGDTGDIKTCPLTGCKPSPRTLASAQAPTLLRSDPKFLYWSTATQILRVAK